jgi:hypothetical protein
MAGFQRCAAGWDKNRENNPMQRKQTRARALLLRCVREEKGLFQSRPASGSVVGTRTALPRYPATAVSFATFQGEIRMLMGALITFLVVILILYLINLLPLDGRAKQIARVVVIILGVISLLKYLAVF